MRMKKILAALLCCLSLSAFADRVTWNMNPGWFFHLGDVSNGGAADLSTEGWDLVSLPHTMRVFPYDLNGFDKYGRSVGWYRKTVGLSGIEGKAVLLQFQGAMQTAEVFVNGQKAGGYAVSGYDSFSFDITPFVTEGDNLIAVRVDNSENKEIPPDGVKHDFILFGGLYRDVFLEITDRVYITYPWEGEKQGIRIYYPEISAEKAVIAAETGIRNTSDQEVRVAVRTEVVDRSGKTVASNTSGESPLAAGAGLCVEQTLPAVTQPKLWSPDSPYLYDLHVYVKDKDGDTVDGYRRRVGIRSVEFRGQDGFWLNGKPYPEPLIGANRHQDFAVIGNALPNSLHWRDAKKLRDAGLRVIRNAHYPQDPAFMDACDELGLFVIVNTPGWQFWSDEPVFAQRVYNDIRNMVRRDRNHPSVWLWEPILNETWYPADFAGRVAEIIKEEYPYPYCYAGCDVTARGHEYFPVLFTHPLNGGGGAFNADELDPAVTYFTREWGDNVDDWSSHNSPSRASRAWGETPMLVQAQGYARFDYPGFTCYDILYRTSRQHVGGCLWHSFDHQRGYHPDPFYGGIMDAFRQPKLSYYMFMSQRPARVNPDLPADSGPMVYIAHSMTPFSPRDVTVYSNCDEVRLTFCKDGETQVYRKPQAAEGMPSPVIVFKDVFDVMQDKALARDGRHAESYLLAEGLMDGKVVATHQVFPARRPAKLLLWADDEGVPLQADGSDMVVVVAAIADEQGNIKRLNNYEVRFEVEGPASLVADAATFTNPRPVSWGTAPVLVRSTSTAGEIKVRASVVWQGRHTPLPAELVIRSVEPAHPSR